MTHDCGSDACVAAGELHPGQHEEGDGGDAAECGAEPDRGDDRNRDKPAEPDSGADAEVN